MKKIFTILIAAFFTGQTLSQTEFNSSVILIEAPDGYGQSSIGAGIIIGSDDNTHYVATAYHVVKNAEKAKVSFYGQNVTNMATVVQVDSILDFAVLRTNSPSMDNIPHFLPANQDIVSVQQKVLTIGHPGNPWKSNYQNIIQEVSLYGQEQFMSITPVAISVGCSGGPVLTYEGIWLGMIVETTGIEAKCIKSNVLLEKLRNWNIPCNFLTPEEPETIEVKHGKYGSMKIDDFSIGKYEVSLEDFRLFIAATGYVTDAEKEGYSWTFYNRSEGELIRAMIIQEAKAVIEPVLESALVTVFSNIQQKISNVFTSKNQSSNTYSVEGLMKTQMYDLFDYRDLGLGSNDPMQNFLYHLFNEDNYNVNDKELEDLLDEMRNKVGSNNYPENNQLQIVFEKLQNKIKYEFEGSGAGITKTFDLAEEMKSLKNILLQSFDYRQIGTTIDISIEKFLDRGFGSNVGQKLKYLDKASWQHDVIGRNRPFEERQHPVIHVSYNDAKAFCLWLSNLHGVHYRLPTTDEWEYAASHQGTNKTPSYDEIKSQENLRDTSFCNWTGWINCYSENDQYPTTAPVNSMLPNDLDLYQIYGNVTEWCTNGQGGPSEKGGAYNNSLLLENETTHYSNFRSGMLGFRVVKEKQ